MICIMQRHPNSRDQNIMFAISQLVKYSKRSDSSMFATFVAYQLICIFDYLFSINFLGLITWYWFCFVMISWGKTINLRNCTLVLFKEWITDYWIHEGLYHILNPCLLGNKYLIRLDLQGSLIFPQDFLETKHIAHALFVC